MRFEPTTSACFDKALSGKPSLKRMIIHVDYTPRSNRKNIIDIGLTDIDLDNSTKVQFIK